MAPESALLSGPLCWAALVLFHFRGNFSSFWASIFSFLQAPKDLSAVEGPHEGPRIRYLGGACGGRGPRGGCRCARGEQPAQGARSHAGSGSGDPE